MKGEADIIEALKALGYTGKLTDEKVLQETINGGPKNASFRQFITWLSDEMHVVGKTEEKIAKDSDFNEFMLEMSGLLKELGCPYSEFIAGPLTSRLQTRQSRLLLFDFLLTELMAMKMCAILKPEESSYIIPVFETSTARALVSITKELNLGKPPDNISPKMLLEKIANRLDETLKKTNPQKLSQPMFNPNADLSNAQWKKLEELQKELDKEYNLRREMLVTRLDVTVQSFQWSEKMKGKEDSIVKRYQKKKQELDQLLLGDIGTDIGALLAAREDLAIIEKTSNANVRKNTASKVEKHVIGRVPDRGGRAYEHAPPPPEMPSWQQNRATGPQGGGRGGGRGGGGRGGGGRGDGGRGGGGRGGGGGWNQPQQQRSQGNNFNQRQDQFNQNQQFGSNQRQQFDQRQQYDQRPQYDSGQQYDQRQQYNNQGGYGGGGNRVQGGWSQRGGQGDNQRGNQYNNNHAGNYGGGQNDNRQDGGRGRSNYNRGGGGGSSGYWR